jgi:uncharacterized membrane protein
VASLAPQRLLLALGVAGGLLLVFVTPPFQVPDEPAHFLRVYQLATGAAAVPGPGGAPGFELPESLPRLADLCLAGLIFHPERRLPPGLLGDAWRMPLAPERRVWMPAARVSQHPPVAYLAAAAPVAIGRLLALRPLALLYLARLGNLAAALAIAWAAVRIAPVQRWLLTLLTLTPMAMFLRSSVSADALTDALALLLVASVLSLALRRAPPAAGPGGTSPMAGTGPEGGSGTRSSVLLVSALLLGAAKEVYCLLALLVFLVSPARRSRRRVALLWGGGLAVLAAAVGYSWWTAQSVAAQPTVIPGVAPVAQLRDVLAAPLRFVAIAGADYADNVRRYVIQLAGDFGWLDTPLPEPAAFCWVFLLLAAAVLGGDPALALAAWKRCWAAAVLAASLLAVSLAMYLVWTPLGAGFIQGLQGRYLLPLLPVAGLVLYNRHLRVPERWCAAVFGVLTAAYTALTLLLIWRRYYGGG